jgi:hypothetical protein
LIVGKNVEGMRSLREFLIPAHVWDGKNSVCCGFTGKLEADKLNGEADAILLIFINSHGLAAIFRLWLQRTQGSRRHPACSHDGCGRSGA